MLRETLSGIQVRVDCYTYTFLSCSFRCNVTGSKLRWMMDWWLMSWRPSLSWSYGSWISNCLYNQCLSSLMLWVRIPLIARCILDTILCDKVLVTCGRLVVFCGYTGFPPPIKLTVTKVVLSTTLLTLNVTW